MIDIEDIPRTGQIAVVAFFSEYKRTSVSTSIQNESRGYLLDNVPLVGERVGLELKPMLFGILRHVEEKKTRSIGVIYHFSYSKMTPDLYRNFLKELSSRFNDELKRVGKIWSRYEVSLVMEVGGI